MARHSHFIEELGCNSYTPTCDLKTNMAVKAAPLAAGYQPEAKIETSNTQKLARKPKKTICSGPIKGIRRLTLHYKRHITQLVTTNVSSSAHARNPCDVDAGSTSYGADMASVEELKRQSERNHLDYIFYIGPEDNDIPNMTRKKRTTTTSRVKVTTELRCPDAPTVWAQAYIMQKDDLEVIERIEKCTRDHLISIGLA